jgi:hypothetical protein
LKHQTASLLTQLNQVAFELEENALQHEAAIIHDVFVRVAEAEKLLEHQDVIQAEMTLEDALNNYDSGIYRVDPKGNWNPEEWITIEEFMESLPEGSLSAPAAIDANHIAFELPDVGFQVVNLVPRSEWGNQPHGDQKDMSEEERQAIQEGMKQALAIEGFECYFNPETKEQFLSVDDWAEIENIEAIAAIMSKCECVKSVDWDYEAGPPDEFIAVKSPKEAQASVGARSASFRNELQKLINSLSKENGSDTPDFILAEYLDDCLKAFDKAVSRREDLSGDEDAVTFVSDELAKAAQVADQQQRYALADAIDSLNARFAKNHGGLDDWFENEKWVDVRRPKKDGGYEPCGRSDSSKGKKPVCTPANKAKGLSDKERKERMRQKSKKEREPGTGKKPKTTTYTDGAGGKSNIS